MVDFRIHTFLKLCDLMNYRATAEALSMTQPAVTQHIQYLEHEYGCRLFRYDGRKLHKTEAAEKLEACARSAVHNDKAVKEEMTGRTVRTVRTVRIGATKTIGDFVIGGMVAEFARRDDYALSLVVDNTEHLLHMLDHDELDFALVEGFFGKEKYGHRLFRKEPFVGICGKDHRFSGRTVPFEELFSETVVVRERGSGTRAILEQLLAEHNYSLESFHKQVSISSFALIKMLVAGGAGVTFAYEAIARSDDALRVFRPGDAEIEREFNYVFLKGTNAERLVDAFAGAK